MLLDHALPASWHEASVLKPGTLVTAALPSLPKIEMIRIHVVISVHLVCFDQLFQLADSVSGFRCPVDAAAPRAAELVRLAGFTRTIYPAVQAFNALH
jgi:hypothetical protein